MSRLPFELLLALRYLRPKRTFVSVITVISILGVMLGVAVLIIVISVMTGFDRQLRERLLRFSAHAKIVPYSGRMTNSPELLPKLRAHPEVAGAAPIVLTQVLIETDPGSTNSRVAAPWVRGISPSQEGEVSNLPESMVEGVFDVRGNGLLVGRDLALQLGIRVNDRVGVYSPKMIQKYRRQAKEGDAEIASDEFTVRGLFDLGYYPLNVSLVVTSLGNAQDLYDLGNAVSGIQLRLHDPLNAHRMKSELRDIIGPDMEVVTWMEENGDLLSAVMVEKNVMFYILFFIVLVAAFGITSVMITFVVQKTREIGVLKALGATNAQVMWIFLAQSLVVGVFGVAAGLGMGMLAVTYRNEFLKLMRDATQFELFPSSIYGFTELPALVVPSDVVIIAGGSLVICVLAGLIPAWNAGRLDPVEALRHE